MAQGSVTPTGNWRRTTAEYAWNTLGRYYAMFPPGFCRETIEGLTEPDDVIIDPFSGRGNMPFTAIALGRQSWGTDVNPIAWLWTAAKLKPERKVDKVLDRIEEIGRAAKGRRIEEKCEFARMAWCEEVRRFLETARELLNWRQVRTDRITMAIITAHMQDRRGEGLSNQLPLTISCSATYAVRWWEKKGLTTPPDIDPVALLRAKTATRYRFGTMERDGMTTAEPRRGEDALRHRGERLNATLLATSPPYRKVTDYWNDHWIRLWMLGEPFRKQWKRTQNHSAKGEYEHMLRRMWQRARRHLRNDASIMVRSDQRSQTAEICKRTLQETWPEKTLHIRETEAAHAGTSYSHGRGAKKAREVDLLLCAEKQTTWAKDQGYATIA